MRNYQRTYLCANTKWTYHVPVCKYQMDLPCTSVPTLNEVASVQLQTTKQVNLVAEHQLRDNNKKAATGILDVKKTILKEQV